MRNISGLFFKTAVVCLLFGLFVGMQMGISDNHVSIPAHAHINLLGWATSAIFGAYYALNPLKANRRLAAVHYCVYTFGIATMLPGLYVEEFYNLPAAPVVGVGAATICVGVLMFAWLVFAKEAPAEVQHQVGTGLPARN
ncbi:hypothetical protein V1291_003776 [Nitrobacteraceae bacterium AZCC 1564]